MSRRVTTCFAVGSLRILRTRERARRKTEEPPSPSLGLQEGLKVTLLSAGMQRQLPGVRPARDSILLPRTKRTVPLRLRRLWSATDPSDPAALLLSLPPVDRGHRSIRLLLCVCVCVCESVCVRVHACVLHRTGGKSAHDPQGASSPSAAARRRSRSAGRARRRPRTAAGWWVPLLLLLLLLLLQAHIQLCSKALVLLLQRHTGSCRKTLVLNLERHTGSYLYCRKTLVLLLQTDTGSYPAGSSHVDRHWFLTFRETLVPAETHWFSSCWFLTFRETHWFLTCRDTLVPAERLWFFCRETLVLNLQRDTGSCRKTLVLLQRDTGSCRKTLVLLQRDTGSCRETGSCPAEGHWFFSWSKWNHGRTFNYQLHRCPWVPAPCLLSSLQTVPGVQHPGGSVPGAGHLHRGDFCRLPVTSRSDATDTLQRMLHGPGRAPGPHRHLGFRVRGQEIKEPVVDDR